MNAIAQKPTVTIKFKAGTVCEVQDIGMHSLKSPLILECDCVLDDGTMIIMSAHVGKNPKEGDDGTQEGFGG